MPDTAVTADYGRIIEESYRPRTVEEMRAKARAPWASDADRAFWNRMAEHFATKPWDECVEVYLSQFKGAQIDGTPTP